MVAVVAAATEVVVAVNVLLVAPAATVTLVGTVTAAELSDNVTTAPPAGAAALSLTVPVDEVPPTTAVGLTVTLDNVADAARVIPNAANSVVLLRLAVSCTVVLSTGNVVTVNVAVVAPAGMLTLGGTLAEPGRLLPRLTSMPPAGAALSIVTLPMADVPPGTLVGLTEKPVRVGRLGATTRSDDSVTPPPVTEIVTVVRLVTAAVVMSKTPTSVEAGTVRESGTAATAGLLLVTRINWSWPRIAENGILTMPREPLVVCTGSSVSELGVGDGVSVIGRLVVTPPKLPLIVRWVTLVTALVWIGNWSPPAPAGMVIVAGTVAAGDELDRLTWMPPGGASPSQKPAKQPTSRSMMPSMSAPPVAFCGNNWNGVSFSFGGRIVIVVLTDVPLNDAVTVTGVGVVTKPTRIGLIELGKPVGATSTSTEVLPAGITRDAGSSGRRFGLLAVNVTVAPPAGGGS